MVPKPDGMLGEHIGDGRNVGGLIYLQVLVEERQFAGLIERD